MSYNQEMEKMKFISLFAGIGGFDRALENVGMECDTVVEIDRNAQNILRRHFPHARMIDDVRKVGLKTHAKGSIDLICGGFPCQDVSVAGKRAGFAGERTSLWHEFARIIDELEPRWVFAENVPGLFSSWSPVETAPHPVEVRDFDTQSEAEEWARSMACEWRVEETSDFEEIISFFQQRGYGLAWRTLDSQYFGVPQRRRRIFLVASLGSGSCAEVLFERECVPGNIETGGEAGEGSAAVPGTSPTLRSEGHDASEDGRGRRALIPDLAGPLRSSGPGVSRAGDSRGQDTVVPVAFQQNTRDEVRLISGDGDIVGALAAEPGAKQQNYIAFDHQSGGDVRMNVSDKPNLSASQIPAVAAFDQSLSPTNRSKVELGEPAPALKNGDRLSIFMAGQGEKAGSVAASEELSPTLKGSVSGLNRVPSVALAGNGSSKWAKGTGGPAGDEVQNLVVADVAPTLDANYAKNTSSDQSFRAQSGDGFPVTTGGVRRLTPRECERLMGHEDDYTAWGIDENGKRVEQSDSSRYKQCGNGVERNTVQWIAKRIKAIDDEENR